MNRSPNAARPYTVVRRSRLGQESGDPVESQVQRPAPGQNEREHHLDSVGDQLIDDVPRDLVEALVPFNEHQVFF